MEHGLRMQLVILFSRPYSILLQVFAGFAGLLNNWRRCYLQSGCCWCNCSRWINLFFQVLLLLSVISFQVSHCEYFNMCRFMVGSELYFMRRLSLPDLAALHYDDDVSVCIVALALTSLAGDIGRILYYSSVADDLGASRNIILI